MKRIHIIGRKNHGKTTLVSDLVAYLTQQGLRVGTIKHTHHHHELDTPGKDSHQHRVAGAARVGILSPTLNACFWPPAGESSGDRDSSRYAEFERMFADCDMILVEGDTQTDATRVEVWRQAVGDPPLATDDPQIVYVVTDDPCPLPEDRIIPRADISAIAARIRAL